MLKMDQDLVALLGGTFQFLVAASVVGFTLSLSLRSEAARSFVADVNERLRVWWVMLAVFTLAMLGSLGAVVIFMFLSFLALREFITLTPTRRGDHMALFWIFFVFLPLQYFFVAIRSYGLFSIFIPVYVFLLLPTRSAISGQTENFLARTSAIQWGLMVCVYCVSHAPALMILTIPGHEGQNANLLFYLVAVVQLGEVLQRLFDRLLGTHKIAPNVIPGRTIEGFVGGVLSASLIGTALWWATPFAFWQSFFIAMIIALFGFAGSLCMAAIKRDRRAKDSNMFVQQGLGGMLEHVDAICFAALISGSLRTREPSIHGGTGFQLDHLLPGGCRISPRGHPDFGAAARPIGCRLQGGKRRLPSQSVRSTRIGSSIYPEYCRRKHGKVIIPRVILIRPHIHTRPLRPCAA